GWDEMVLYLTAGHLGSHYRASHLKDINPSRNFTACYRCHLATREKRRVEGGIMSSSYRAALGYREPASRRDYSRNIVGRDFMSNRPRYGEYGDMDRPPEHEVAGHEAARVDLPEDEYARRREYFHRGDYESDW